MLCRKREPMTSKPVPAADRRDPVAGPHRRAVAGCPGPVRSATRYGKLAVRYEATVHIAATNQWLRPRFLDTP